MWNMQEWDSCTSYLTDIYYWKQIKNMKAMKSLSDLPAMERFKKRGKHLNNFNFV